MNNQLSLLIPTITEDIGASEDHDASIFEQKGSVEEILLCGPDLAMASLLSSKNNPPAQIILELVHLHATRDHIVLMPPQMLDIQESEALALRASVQEILEHYVGPDGECNPSRWIYPAGDFIDLLTHSPQLVSGLNIDIWMPKDLHTPGIAKKWRQFQNEIQMVWHNHPVNAARLERGVLSINSIWLYANAPAQNYLPHECLTPVTKIFSHHPLGSALDARLTPLLLENIIPPANEHNVVFAEHLPLTEWEDYWLKSLNALQQKKIQKLQLWQYRAGKLHYHTVTHPEFSSRFLPQFLHKRLPQKSQAIAWVEYAKKLHWTPVSVDLCK